MSEPEYRAFLSCKNFSTHLLLDNLHLRSISFRYAIRVSLVACSGFVIASGVASNVHSYWILYTIVFVLKPTYSLSKERSIYRVGGTITGSALVLLLLAGIHDRHLLTVALMLFILTGYSFQQLNYFIFVTFVTAAVILLYRLEGFGSGLLVHERVLDNLIGATVALLANYLILPVWELRDIDAHLDKEQWTNTRYLEEVVGYSEGRAIDLPVYKKLRMDAYTSLAVLKAAYDRMIGNPNSKHRNKQELHQYIVFNFLILSWAGSLMHGMNKNRRTYILSNDK